ncbi:MAG: hypothetical protein HQM15_04115 [Deltaproteobacteria bacterium]|nr:hypothetical protein [Deltaproteobacteria bacterium]
MMNRLWRNSLKISFLIIPIFLFFVGQPLQATPSDFDTSFGPTHNGKVTTGFTAADGSSINDGIEAIAVQPADGKIIVAGESGDTTSLTASSALALARYNPDGSLDTTFSGGTIRLDAFNSTPLTGINTVKGIAFQGSNIILGVATGNISASLTGNCGIVRLLSNGSVDTGFGSGGLATAAGSSNFCNAMAVQGDGKIVLGGFTVVGGSAFDSILIRFTRDGLPDSSFGSGSTGVVVNDFGGNDMISAVAVQPDITGEKIVVAGAAKNATSTDLDFLLARFNETNGSLDTSFGSAGVVKTDFSSAIHPNSTDHAFALALKSDESILAGGASTSGAVSSVFALAFYDKNGAPLHTPTTSISGLNDGISSLLIQSDNKIVAGGYSGPLAAPQAVLARYNSDGTLDPLFGTTGSVTNLFGGSHDVLKALAIQGDGKILAAGAMTAGSNEDFALVRLMGSATGPDLGGPPSPAGGAAPSSRGGCSLGISNADQPISVTSLGIILNMVFFLVLRSFSKRAHSTSY